MGHQEPLIFLFVINPVAGKHTNDWPAEIDRFFAATPHTIEKYFLEKNHVIDALKNKISETNPHKVIAVGGDGTVKIVAECLLYSERILGILPAGSANGLATELGIPSTVQEALQFLLSSESTKIHLVKVNNQYCTHLSDMGFNASVIKIFESNKQRGMMGYIKAAWRVLWKHAVMQVTIKIDDTYIRRDAAMVVVANGTMYGSGAVINPLGRLDDELFEVVIIKKVSFSEIFKMMVTHQAYDKSKTELYQAQMVQVQSKKKAHFQVDGEYLGKINKLSAELLPRALNIIK